MILICLKIFFARILDVSLGTIKTFYVLKEKKIIAFIISFIELIIWYYAARTALSLDVSSILIPISYALGYATGTYIGMFFSVRYIKGNLVVTIVSDKITKKDINRIKREDFGITSIKTEDNKRYLIVGVNKANLERLKSIITQIDGNSFMIINDTKIIHNGYLK